MVQWSSHSPLHMGSFGLDKDTECEMASAASSALACLQYRITIQSRVKFRNGHGTYDHVKQLQKLSIPKLWHMNANTVCLEALS